MRLVGESSFEQYYYGRSQANRKMTQTVYCQDYFLTQRKIKSGCIWNPPTMNREPGNRNKTANAPTCAVELSSQLKYNEKIPEIWTLRRRNHNTAKKFCAYRLSNCQNRQRGH